MRFDVINDCHIDFWVRINSNQVKMKNALRRFVEVMLPERPSRTLVLSGDVGHINSQNVMFLEVLREIYNEVLLVAGNHDYYLVSSKQRKKYRNNSMLRFAEMKKAAEAIGNVYYLDGTTLEIEGVVFGGTGMWYDFSYPMHKMGMRREEASDIWWEISNDSQQILGTPKRVIDMFELEKEKLTRVFSESDVVVTHVSPDASKTPFTMPDENFEKYIANKGFGNIERTKEAVTGFYFFDGSDFLNRAAGKVWCFGHIHAEHDYTLNGCRLISNALGYPDESFTQRKIKTISI